MNIGSALVLLVWALVTISVWCNAIYGVWLTHAEGLNAQRQRVLKLGVALGETLGTRRAALIISYAIRFALATGSTVAWLYTFDRLL